MKRTLLALLIIPIWCFSQKETLQEINGLPTKEVYDLLIDTKGFLWIAHELGLTRYDGYRLTNFSNPASQSLSAFDIVEDKQGRIWCHNFAGQVFYVENEKMQWYKAYDHTIEHGFSRMVLAGNKIVLTSKLGLFVCETSTLAGKYIKCIEEPTAYTLSVSLFNNLVIARNDSSYFVYDPAGKQHFNKIKLFNDAKIPTSFNFVGITNINIPYLATSVESLLFRLELKENILHIADIIKLKDYINGVSSVNNSRWIHTKSKSISDKNEIVEGYNLTDVVEDKQGNLWFSSLEKGLLVKYRKQWQKHLPPLLKNDFIRQLTQTKNLIIYGTQQGHLYFQDKSSKKITHVADFHKKGGSIEYLQLFSEDYLLIGLSGSPCFFNITNKTVKTGIDEYTLKDAAVSDSLLFTAASKGIYKVVTDDKWLFLQRKSTILISQRARAVSYDPVHNTLLVAIKNGLFLIKDNKITPVLYNGKHIYASAIKFYKDKFLVSSYLNGLYIIKNGVVKNINVEQGLTSSNVMTEKLEGKRLWLTGPSFIDVVDVETEAISRNIIIPKLPSIKVFDIAEIDNQLFITTSDGLFSTPFQKKTNKATIETRLLKVVVNDSTITKHNKSNFRFNQNEIEFHLASPFLDGADKIYFRYRLLGSYQNNWTKLSDNGNVVRFASLMPGKYRFEAVAVHPQLGTSRTTVVYQFTISPPWYNKWWFIILVLLSLVSLILLAYRARIRRVLREERIRRIISVDLHDDIGSTLSTINIYSELARKEKNYIQYIQLIQENTTNIISKLDDLVWNINPKNDSVFSLIEKLKSVAFSILPAKGIVCDFKVQENDYKNNLSSEIRKNVFLAFKEIINNIVKHSDSTECKIEIFKKGKKMTIIVRDNGKGLLLENVPADRNGLENLSIRAEEIKGKFSIESTPGSGTEITFSFKVG